MANKIRAEAAKAKAKEMMTNEEAQAPSGNPEAPANDIKAKSKMALDQMAQILPQIAQANPETADELNQATSLITSASGKIGGGEQAPAESPEEAGMETSAGAMQ